MLHLLYNVIINVANLKDAPIKYEDVGGSLKMANHQFPWSIRPAEMLTMINFIVKNNLKCGYEVATAFGVSTLGIGLGMKLTGGKLVTMDCYIEEKMESYVYENIDRKFEDADGYKSVNFLVDTFGLRDTVFPTVGWSPGDTESRLRTVLDLEKDKIDFVFIDANHTNEAAILDLGAVLPFLAPRYAVFFHDCHCFDNRLHDFIRENLGQTLNVLPDCTHPHGYNLGVVTNIKE